MIINGLDLLFIVIAFVLLFGGFEIWDRYNNWYEWNNDRRRQRKHFRYEFKDNLDEKQYRQHLRLMFRLKLVTIAFTNISKNFENFNKAMNDINKAFQKFAMSQKKHST